jgi:poly(A) polymerase/tRNA nucleotidyltransferase (CCA-adding enzyme)
MSELQIPPQAYELLHTLQGYLEAHKVPSWLVGGSVRDLVLNRPIADLDVAVDGDAPELARAFADATGGAWVLLDAETGSARVVWPEAGFVAGRPRTLDLVRLRAASIQDDLRGRDFTINALALPLEHLSDSDAQLIDPLGGLEDLRQHVLRACAPTSISDDPLRMLRAVRLAGQLNFTLADDLVAELRERHSEILRVSAERIRDELLKILSLPYAGQWVEFLDDVRLLTTIIPELEPSRDCDQPNLHFLPVLGHLIEAVVAADWLLDQLGEPGDDGTRIVPDAVWAIPELSARLPFADRLLAHFDEIVDGVPRLALFKLAVLLHDVAKPQTKGIKPDGGVTFYDHQAIGAEIAWNIARRLRLSRAACDYVRLIVREHMRPGQLNALGPALTLRAVYRFFRATGSSGPEVLLHSLCDHLAMQGPNLDPAGWEWHVGWTAEMLHLFYEEPTTIRPEPILRGDDLIRELGMQPGPAIGRLLEDVREAQAAGEIRTREEALAWARQHLSATSVESG